MIIPMKKSLILTKSSEKFSPSGGPPSGRLLKRRSVSLRRPTAWGLNSVGKHVILQKKSVSTLTGFSPTLFTFSTPLNLNSYDHNVKIKTIKYTWKSCEYTWKIMKYTNEQPRSRVGYTSAQLVYQVCCVGQNDIKAAFTSLNTI